MQEVRERPDAVDAGEYFSAGYFTEQDAEQLIAVMKGELPVGDLDDRLRYAAASFFTQIAMLRRALGHLRLRASSHATLDEWRDWENATEYGANPPNLTDRAGQ